MKGSGVLAVTGLLLLCLAFSASARRVPLSDHPLAKATAVPNAKATSTGGQATATAKASATAGAGGPEKIDVSKDSAVSETKHEAPKTTLLWATTPKEELEHDDFHMEIVTTKDTTSTPKDEPKEDDKETKPSNPPKDDTTSKPEQTPKPAPKTGSGKPGDGAIGAFLAYTAKCGKTSTAPAAECSRLSGALCSRKDIKCSENKTEFLDDSGVLVATGTNDARLICYAEEGKGCIAA